MCDSKTASAPSDETFLKEAGHLSAEDRRTFDFLKQRFQLVPLSIRGVNTVSSTVHVKYM